MSSFRKIKRSRFLQVSAASLASTMLLSTGVYSAVPIFDNITPLETGVGLGTNYGLYYTGGNPNDVPADSPLTDTYEGEAYVLPSNISNLTGLDLLYANATNDMMTFNDGSGINFNAVKITAYIWGTVTPTPAFTGNSSTPALNSSNKAFSNLLATESVIEKGYDVPAGALGDGENFYAPGFIPYFTFPTPVNVTPSSTIGVTFNVQGSHDGGATFSNVQGLTPLFAADALPTVGAQQVSTSFYINSAGETDGNFTQGPDYFQVSDTDSTPIENTGVTARLYGTIPVGPTYSWNDSSGGVFNDATQWNPQAVPGANNSAIFNLSSSAGYVVEVPDVEGVTNLMVQKDNVQIDLDAQQSNLIATGVLSVGVSPTAGTVIKGTLTLINTEQIYTGVVEGNAIVIGGNGGTGSISVQEGTLLYCNADTFIGAGSNLSIQSFAKFGSGTLTIAGTTNAWTGQLDIGPSAVDLRNGSIGTVINQIKSGYNNGKWTGEGITSLNAANDTTHLTAVGAIVNNDGNGNPLYGSGTSLGLFDGGAPPLNAVLVRYTYFGDANLDGKVDGSDYSLIDNGALNHLTGWYNGDFNYDGIINGSDYTLIDNAYNQQGMAIPFQFAGNSVVMDAEPDTLASIRQSHVTADSSNATASDSTLEATVGANTTAEIAPSAVPEPASLGSLALAAIPLLVRRMRRSNRN